MKKSLKRSILIVAICIGLVLNAGCQKQSLAYLPSNPIVFQSGTYVNPADAQDEYMLINYNGRSYVPYGTLKSTIRAKDITRCLGYIDGSADCLICTLSVDPNEDFLVMISEGAVMDQPLFYRAIDTTGQQITVPTYIADLGYDIW